MYRENNLEALRLEKQRSSGEFQSYTVVDQVGEEKFSLESRAIHVEGYGQGMHIRTDSSNGIYQEYRDYIWKALHTEI
jgi:hypothetical protein